MKFKINIRREVKGMAVLVLLFGLIAFTERMKDHVTVKDIRISIENIHENHFLDEEDIMNLMKINQQHVIGLRVDQLDFKAIEKKIRQHPFIADAQLYSDLKGQIMVQVQLRRPVARLVRNDGPDGYIAEDGTIMPVSDKFTSRVMLISGGFVKHVLQKTNLVEDENGKKLMELVERLREDEFWSAQIAQLDIDSRSQVVLFPQIGDEKIEFGSLDLQEKKLTKLKIFYKEVVPRVGWNKYSRVNLEYDGQIVAE